MNLNPREKNEPSSVETLLGIDIGSVTISIVQMDWSGHVLKTIYLFHKGQIRECLKNAGKQIDLTTIR